MHRPMPARPRALPCPDACEVPEGNVTRTVLAITAWFASVAICTGLVLVWLYGV